ncbi:MAG: biopolymer transporter ExbD [Ignavibacteriae bacterium]|nr:biopolymer transporter ExbD [Ignavibacteriota bacterium]
MGMVDTSAPRGHEKKKKKRRKMRRIGIKIDNTPMVDVAFLLLTFFMLTTTMNRPQTMEINLPPEKTTVEVAESNLLTLLVKEDGSIYWRIGSEKPEKIEFKDLRSLVVQKSQQNPKLITLIKIDRKGKYQTMVDLMDELNLANMTRFSLAPMQDTDRKKLEEVTS